MFRALRATLIVPVLGLANCAMQYVPDGPNVMPLSQVQSHCNYEVDLATSGNYGHSFHYYRNAKEAAFSGLAEGLAQALEHARLQNECIEANGWHLERVKK
jgi:hypothetical protein